MGNAVPEAKKPSPNKLRVFKEEVVIAPQTFKRGVTNSYKRSGKKQRKTSENGRKHREIGENIGKQGCIYVYSFTCLLIYFWLVVCVFLYLLNLCVGLLID